MALVQAPPPAAVSVHTEPAVPVRGGFAWIVIRGDSMRPARGESRVDVTVAGQTVTADRAMPGVWRALVAIPIEEPSPVGVHVVVATGATRTDTDVPVVTKPGAYRSERLSVDPSMAAPDSVAQIRIAKERELALEVGRRALQTPRLWTDGFGAPRPGRITSNYGTARVFNGSVASRHLGIDFAGSVGAPVQASSRGVVALVADFLLAGTTIYINHGEGITTGYFHLSRTMVAVGDTVVAGQAIGAVGRSGRVTGPHLHWATRFGTLAADGATLLQLAAPGRAPTTP